MTPTPTTDPRPLTYGIVLFDGAEELDFVGPWEVFTASRMVRDAAGDTPTGTPDTVVTIAERTDPITAAKGMRVLPDHTFADAPALDVVVVPGGQGTRREVDNPAVLDYLRTVHESTVFTTSVCTGSLLLFGAGITAGPVATHWGFEDELERRGATVVRDARWVRDGRVVSSQGVSAGIDMALWLIGQLHEPRHARQVQHYIQYDPAPPYQADV